MSSHINSRILYSQQCHINSIMHLREFWTIDERYGESGNWRRFHVFEQLARNSRPPPCSFGRSGEPRPCDDDDSWLLIYSELLPPPPTDRPDKSATRSRSWDMRGDARPLARPAEVLKQRLCVVARWVSKAELRAVKQEQRSSESISRRTRTLNASNSSC